MAKQSASPITAYGLGILRLVSSFLFLCHGLQKVFGLLGGHRVHLVSLLGLAGGLELVGGILLFLGLYTRPVAFVLCGEMATAYFRNFFRHGVLPITNGGELAALYCFVFLLFVVAGPGIPSVDSNIRNR